MNPKSGSSSTAASPAREGGGGRMDQGHKPKRLYQVWKGSNIWKFGFFWGSNFILLIVERFFCGGRLILGPDVASIFLTTLLIAAPAIAFCIKVYYKIVDEGSVNARWYPVLVVGSILTVLVSISFFHFGFKEAELLFTSS
ncbi:hypothetical protein POTOM_022457 [Populus tomentosa]|uniref:Uncharacterized protein n=1 Tax=Populus tomentosa TaxID=118781 RepID=A0A8X8CPU4_POPTO|nr:hypothetical protein POTOM_022457 [Populus tomentosa]